MFLDGMRFFTQEARYHEAKYCGKDHELYLCGINAGGAGAAVFTFLELHGL